MLIFRLLPARSLRNKYFTYYSPGRRARANSREQLPWLDN